MPAAACSAEAGSGPRAATSRYGPRSAANSDRIKASASASGSGAGEPGLPRPRSGSICILDTEPGFHCVSTSPVAAATPPIGQSAPLHAQVYEHLWAALIVGELRPGRPAEGWRLGDPAGRQPHPGARGVSKTGAGWRARSAGFGRIPRPRVHRRGGDRPLPLPCRAGGAGRRGGRRRPQPRPAVGTRRQHRRRATCPRCRRSRRLAAAEWRVSPHPARCQPQPASAAPAGTDRTVGPHGARPGAAPRRRRRGPAGGLSSQPATRGGRPPRPACRRGRRGRRPRGLADAHPSAGDRPRHDLASRAPGTSSRHEHTGCA